MSRPAANVLRLCAIALLGLAAGVACASGDARESADAVTKTVTHVTTETVTSSQTTSAPAPFSAPEQRFPPYQPPAGEVFPNGKRLAARVAQELATFGPKADAAELADGAGAQPDLERVVAPLLEPSRRSAGEVLYVQLSGVTATTLGTMVVVRQHLEDGEGNREQVVRVMDIRLRRTGGPWLLERVASVGGTPVPRPSTLSRAALRVLDHPNIELADTARWDIYRGLVGEELLQALADAADRRRLAITVFRTGHPPNVWAAGRVSAHTLGRAADIYAVDRVPVVGQRAEGSSAQRLAEAFLAGGAKQVGSPWVLTPGGRRSFTDRVHQDHLHVDVGSGAIPPPQA